MKNKLSFLALLCFLAMGIVLAGTDTTQASDAYMPPAPTTVPPSSGSAPKPKTGCGYDPVYCDKYGKVHLVVKGNQDIQFSVNGERLSYMTDEKGNADISFGNPGETYTIQIVCDGNTFYRKVTCPSPRQSGSDSSCGTESKFLYLPSDRLRQTKLAHNSG